MQATPEFVELRRKLRRFVFPMSAAFLVWYLLYVLLASFAPGFMATPVFGNINIGLLIGLLQFVTTFVITTVYVRFAHEISALKLRVEGHVERMIDREAFYQRLETTAGPPA